jgi:hypothetical protein
VGLPKRNKIGEVYMKKIISGLLLAILTFSACAFADEIKQVTSETIFYIKAIHTVPENAFQNFNIFTASDSVQKQEQLISFLKSCQPYNENININFFGFDATLNIHSNGRHNEKCSYEFSGQVNNIPPELLSSSEISASDILSMRPKMTCEFTQEQLEALVYTISETFSEININNISKIEAKQNLKNKLANDERLKSLFKDSKACTLTGLAGEDL